MKKLRQKVTGLTQMAELGHTLLLQLGDLGEAVNHT